jgi:hypothetical protein
MAVLGNYVKSKMLNVVAPTRKICASVLIAKLITATGHNNIKIFLVLELQKLRQINFFFE